MTTVKLHITEMGKDTAIMFEGYTESNQTVYTNDERENILQDVFLNVIHGANIMGIEKPDMYLTNIDPCDDTSELYMVVEKIPYYMVIGMLGTANQNSDTELYHVDMFI